MGINILKPMEFDNFDNSNWSNNKLPTIDSLRNDPADLTALTPGHFLIGAPLTSIPEPELTQ